MPIPKSGHCPTSPGDSRAAHSDPVRKAKCPELQQQRCQQCQGTFSSHPQGAHGEFLGPSSVTRRWRGWVCSGQAERTGVKEYSGLQLFLFPAWQNTKRINIPNQPVFCVQYIWMLVMVTVQNIFSLLLFRGREGSKCLEQFPGLPEPFSHSKDLSSLVPFQFYWRKSTVFCSLLEVVKKSLSDSKCYEELKHWKAQANPRSFCKVTPIHYKARWAFTGSSRKKGDARNVTVSNFSIALSFVCHEKE